MSIRLLPQEHPISQYYNRIAEYLNTHGFSMEALARQAALLSNHDYTGTLEVCQAMDLSIRELRAASSSLDWKKTLNVEDVLKAVTASMSDGERMGYYLTIYDAYRAADAQTAPEAAQSREGYELLPDFNEEALRALVAQRLNIACNSVLASYSKVPTPNDTPTYVDPLVLSTAYWVAGTKGELQNELAQYPQLLGIACGIVEQAQVLDFDEQDGESLLKAICVLLALGVGLGVATLVSRVSPELSNQMLKALNSGKFGHLVDEAILEVLRNLPEWLPRVASSLSMLFTYLTGETLVNHYRPLHKKQVPVITIAEKTQQTAEALPKPLHENANAAQ